MSRGFITEGLKRHPGADDWVCVEDFCGRCDGEPANFAAWWSPSRGFTAFLGQWYDAPTMPGAHQPTDKECWNWAMEHTNWGRKKQAEDRRKAKRDAAFDVELARRKQHGVGWAEYSIALPDGKTIESAQPVPWCRTMADLRQSVSTLILGYLDEKRARREAPRYPGARIARLRFSIRPWKELEAWQQKHGSGDRRKAA